MKTSNSERFWTKVDKSGECWEWNGHVSSDGYGTHRGDNGKYRRAHRIAYEYMVGDIPAGLVIDHLCRNRSCVNPAHLEPVTIKENILRVVGTSAQNARKTHCIKGHEYTPENTLISRGYRVCRSCKRTYAHAHKARKRALRISQKAA